MGSEVEAIPQATLELMDVLDIRLSDPDKLATRIAMRLAVANTPEDLFADGGSYGWEEHQGRPVVVKNVDWVRSGFSEGLGIFAVVEAIDANTNETLILTTGATNVLVQLAKAAKMGWLDKPVMLERSSQPTSNGYYPMRLKLA